MLVRRVSCLRSGQVVGLSRTGSSIGLVLALTAALVAGSVSPVGAVAGYGDVAGGTWYTDAVQWSVDNGIADVSGFCFAPDAPVSRGETAVWIYNMENRPDAGDPHSFVDVINASQDDAISWMANNEITTGTSTTTFGPDETLRRAQIAAFLYRLAGEPSAPPHSFDDVVAGWQQDSVSWMSHSGITTGTSPTTFAPEDTLTRAQLITFLYRYQGEPEVTVNASTPYCDPSMPTIFKAVSAGGSHSCGLRSDDTIVCWGQQAELLGGGFKAVSAGGDHSCGLRSDGTIVCWGSNLYGQTDAPAGTFEAVSAGRHHSCAVRGDDNVVCWGSNVYGKTEAPTGTFEAVSAGGDHSCAMSSNDAIVCWGRQADAPTGTFKAVSAGENHSCAIRGDDTAVCWGDNQYGQTDAPTGTFEAVSAGGGHSCAIRGDGTIVCWGSNESGQADAPTGTFKAVSAGGDHSCAIRGDGTVVCWGDDSWRQASVPTRTVKAGIVNDNPNNIPGYDPDVFYTEDNELSRFIKEGVVDRYAVDNPWLLETWNHTNRPDFRYVVANGTSTVSFSHIDAEYEVGEVLDKFVAADMFISTNKLNDRFISNLVHELAHVYTLSDGANAHPGPTAIAHLYFDQLGAGNGRCTGAELYAEAAEMLVPARYNYFTYYWHNCSHLPSRVTPEAIEVVEDAFAGHMPQWFYDTFQKTDGSLDYEMLWTAVKNMLLRNHRIDVVYQLRNEFGGYCSEQAARDSAFGDLDLAQPWRDGGCPTE